jgi:hypothetical protein
MILLLYSLEMVRNLLVPKGEKTAKEMTMMIKRRSLLSLFPI